MDPAQASALRAMQAHQALAPLVDPNKLHRHQQAAALHQTHSFDPPSNGASSSAFNSGFDMHSSNSSSSIPGSSPTHRDHSIPDRGPPSNSPALEPRVHSTAGNKHDRSRQASMRLVRLQEISNLRSRANNSRRHSGADQGLSRRDLTSGHDTRGQASQPNAFRGGRGGGTIRPVRPFASHSNVNQQSGPTDRRRRWHGSRSQQSANIST